MFVLGLQLVLTLPPCLEPVRFGVPLPVVALEQGLSVRGKGRVQVRPLGLRAGQGLAWIEVAVVQAEGAIRLHAGRDQSDPADVAYRFHRLPEHAEEWLWHDGTRDRRTRQHVVQAMVDDGERFEVGEAITWESAGLSSRWLVVARLPRKLWERVGLLPRRAGSHQQSLDHLREVGRALVELPGRRGAGDYARSGGIVTNLEFDMPLAFLRLGLACADVQLLERARRAAWHLVDRDLDHRSGLPFAHGLGHRKSTPSMGHAWLTGVLWVGALTADEPLLEAARQIARALAGQPPHAPAQIERARDYGWPLAEMEAYLGMMHDPVVAAAADRMAAEIRARYDSRLATFRFGEGEGQEDSYLERAWITGGILLPALHAHLQRRPDPALQKLVDDVGDNLLRICLQGGPGVATHWRYGEGGPFGLHYARQDAKVWMMLEGFSVADRARMLGKGRVQRAMRDTPHPQHPDRATQFAMVARNLWVYRGSM